MGCYGGGIPGKEKTMKKSKAFSWAKAFSRLHADEKADAIKAAKKRATDRQKDKAKK